MKETSIILLSSLCTCVTSLSISRLTADNQNTDNVTAAEASSSLEQSESHRRMKRWAQYGNKVWNDTIRIGYANYANTYSILDQDQILRECTQMWTRPNYLEFEIIRPSWFNKAHITISFKYFNQRTEMAGYATLGYSFPPRPHDAEGSKIVLSPPSRNLPLRKYDSRGGSFKLILCHEIGHTLGLLDVVRKDSIMHYNTGDSIASDRKLDWDSSYGVSSLYRKPLNHYRQKSTTTTTTRRTPTRQPTRRRYWYFDSGRWRYY